MAQLNFQVTAALSLTDPIITTRSAKAADDEEFRDHLRTSPAESSLTDRSEEPRREVSQSPRQDVSTDYDDETSAADDTRQPNRSEANTASSDQAPASDAGQEQSTGDESTKSQSQNESDSDNAAVVEEGKSDEEQLAENEKQPAEKAPVEDGSVKIPIAAEAGKPLKAEEHAAVAEFAAPTETEKSSGAETTKSKHAADDLQQGQPPSTDQERVESKSPALGNRVGGDESREKGQTDTEADRLQADTTGEANKDKQNRQQNNAPAQDAKASKTRGRHAEHSASGAGTDVAKEASPGSATRAARNPGNSAADTVTTQAPNIEASGKAPATTTPTTADSPSPTTPVAASAAQSETAVSSGAKAKSGGKPSSIEGGKQSVEGADRRTPEGTTRSQNGVRQATSSDSMNPASRVRFVRRVVKAFHAAGSRGGEVRLRLSPPELGSLKLQVSVRDGLMTARIEVETPAAQAALMDNLPQLRQRLAEQDVQIQQFDVELTGDNSGGARGAFEDSSSETDGRGSRQETQQRDAADDASQPASSGPRHLEEPRELNVLV